ncbi:hypothetical protein HmCmsJML007_03025 [Escherichia coli]|nr:hypothetical protein HmCmsJML007_03025 [Escherichia coli]
MYDVFFRVIGRTVMMSIPTTFIPTLHSDLLCNNGYIYDSEYIFIKYSLNELNQMA